MFCCCFYFTGHLHTFDFHEQRVTLARKEFERHKLGGLVTVKQRDVCQNGFDLENVADAVFLDLPHPWDAIPHAKKGLNFIFPPIFAQYCTYESICKSKGAIICYFGEFLGNLLEKLDHIKYLWMFSGIVKIASIEIYKYSVWIIFRFPEKVSKKLSIFFSTWASFEVKHL